MPDTYAEKAAPDPADFGLPTDDDGSRDDPLLGQNIRTCVPYPHDIHILTAASTRIVIAVGKESEGEMAARGAAAIAEHIGTEPAVFPSHHGGFLGGEYGMYGDPDGFRRGTAPGAPDSLTGKYAEAQPGSARLLGADRPLVTGAMVRLCPGNVDDVLVGAAVCPHPPLLVPEVAAGAAAELDGLRAACDKALRRAADGVDLLAVVGSGPVTRRYNSAAGTLAGYGVDVRVGRGEPVLPLSLTIGLWLVERTLDPSTVELHGVRSDTSPDVCARLGATVAVGAERVGLLVMGDGSARRAVQSPHFVDERALGFEIAVRRALAVGKPRELLDLDPRVADDLLVAGRAPWQVLAGAALAGDMNAGAAGMTRSADPEDDGRHVERVSAVEGGETGAFTAELLADEAPYGVTYLVASWARHRT